MSLFAGAPNYAPIIWKPDQYPEENGISGLMAGLGVGMQTGGDYKKAKKEYGKQSWSDPTGPRPDKPNPFRFYFGTAPEQQPQKTNMTFDSNINPNDLHALIDQLFGR